MPTFEGGNSAGAKSLSEKLTKGSSVIRVCSSNSSHPVVPQDRCIYKMARGRCRHLIHLVGVIFTFVLLASPGVNCILPFGFELDDFLGITARKAEEKVDQMLTRCYGEYGCFSIGGKFISIHRPVNLFPYSADVIGPRFQLFTRKNQKAGKDLQNNDEELLKNSHFNASVLTKFIVHGFLEHGNVPWILTMKDELLAHENFNVIAVDWAIGALPPYTQAVANARMIGAILARFIKFLMNIFHYKPEMCHIIGHSLGAHIGGYAGERLHKLGRISGLDPAGPYFEGTDPSVKLDPSDALFVDVIHTDGSSLLNRAFGIYQPIGHVDFYANGGVTQPGCGQTVIEALEREDGDIYRGMRQWVGCQHIRAYEYYTESINTKCPFQSYECSSHEAFERGRCTNCGENGEMCANMGYWAIKFQKTHRRPPVRMFLKTNPDPPYCTYHYKMTVETARIERNYQNDSFNGILLVQLSGDEKVRSEFATEFNTQEVTFEPGRMYTYVVNSPSKGPLKKLRLQLVQGNGLANQLARIFIKDDPSLKINDVTVQNLETSITTEFCSGNKTLKLGTQVTLTSGNDCS